MDTITITRDDFAKAVKNANTKFMNIVGKDDNNLTSLLTTLMMMVQNETFCELVGYELFGDEPK